ncbi:FAD-binding oxidoreductase [Sphingopyxis sp. KK2]|uniref:NAD(P)/FAD-dependent oxidoreductase n=1 Tax=Sphingopyxis sp. KK2 TaxID=1855727 RepID=UPI00097E6573|nr:FAD-dependent oxidoreductase [Sphingopyxis sp. KK2]
MTAALPSDIDVLIVGAGIAGASLAAELAPYRRVLMIEAEDMPGFHATGRSAAFWQESYGGVGVQPLTAASFDALAHPHPDFSDRGFLLPRTAVMIGRRDEAAAVDGFVTAFAAQGVEVSRLSPADLAVRVAGLRPAWSEGAYEPSCRDIDVGGLHAAYLRAAKRAGALLAVRAPLVSARRTGGGWAVETGQGPVRAALVVNAAGAWADAVARACGVAPVGIQPYRRTIAQVRLGVPTPATLPLVGHVGGTFYFKGEGEGRIWLSPHDETPSAACDAAPEEIDVALAIDRLQSVVDWPVAAVERKWAGLRSFAPDRLPVFGSDPDVPDFIWCAGQGGFGIQTAPAIAGLLAWQLGAPAPEGAISAIDPAAYARSRFG